MMATLILLMAIFWVFVMVVRVVLFFSFIASLGMGLALLWAAIWPWLWYNKKS
jgi:hypothetical protein